MAQLLYNKLYPLIPTLIPLIISTNGLNLGEERIIWVLLKDKMETKPGLLYLKRYYKWPLLWHPSFKRRAFHGQNTVNGDKYLRSTFSSNREVCDF
jgi:hypothetical protein